MIMKNRTALLLHTQIHTGEKQYKCKHCEKCFVQKRYLVKHQQIHTSNNKCGLCEKYFTTKMNLKQHHQRIHLGDKPYQCVDCEKCFLNYSDLVSHMKTHTGEKPYQCSHCEKRFLKNSDLVRHMKVHTGEKPYQCSYCKKYFCRKPYML
ncbi:unnamed protein product, partial [Meganyctiphanes norvegica]